MKPIARTRRVQIARRSGASFKFLLFPAGGSPILALHDACLIEQQLGQPAIILHKRIDGRVRDSPTLGFAE
jgi:hypothetical protein